MARGPGYFMAYGVKVGARLEEYVRLAENGLYDTLEQALDRNTQDSDAHPNAVILAAVTIMATQAKMRGQSNVPAVQAYTKAVGGDRSLADRLGLHLPRIIGRDS